MTIPIKLQVGKKIVEANALIDSGAGGIFINKDFVDKNNLFVKEISKPLTAFNVDGTINKQGTITHVVKATIIMGERQSESGLLVTGLGKQDVILGFNWLKKENPLINWTIGSIQWREPRVTEERVLDKTKNPIPSWYPTTSTLIPNQQFKEILQNIK